MSSPDLALLQKQLETIRTRASADKQTDLKDGLTSTSNAEAEYRQLRGDRATLLTLVDALTERIATLDVTHQELEEPSAVTDDHPHACACVICSRGARREVFGEWWCEPHAAIREELPADVDADQLVKALVGATNILNRAYTLVKRDNSTDLVVTQLICELFAGLPEVETVFQCRGEGAIHVWVFTSGQVYDDKLMDLLVSQELTIFERFPAADLVFRYIPTIFCEDYTDVVGEAAEIIFKRPG